VTEQKIIGDPDHYAHVIGMHALKHRHFDPFQDVAAVYAHGFTESVGDQDGYGRMIYILIINKGKRAAFVCFF